MILLRDLPIILALFAFIFGGIGLMAYQNQRLRQQLPKLRRNSYLYLLSAVLLTVSLAIKTRLSPQDSLRYELALLAQPQIESLQSLLGQPKSVERNVRVEPKINLAFSFVTIDLTSDPMGADVFINRRLRGQTPLKLLIPQNQTVTYRVSAAPNPEKRLRYESFEGIFQEAENRQVSVWLDRITQ
jgi:hypothetical protein